MRKIDELLEILLENIDHMETGLCSLNSRIGYFSWHTRIEEYDLVRNYIYDHPPKNLRYLRHKISGSNGSYFYWKKGWKAPRRRWLKKHIKKCT